MTPETHLSNLIALVCWGRKQNISMSDNQYSRGFTLCIQKSRVRFHQSNCHIQYEHPLFLHRNYRAFHILCDLESDMQYSVFPPPPPNNNTTILTACHSWVHWRYSSTRFGPSKTKNVRTMFS